MRTDSSINSGARTLRGMVHLPDDTQPEAVVCMFPGLDGTKVGPHRMLVHLSEALEAEGVASVRYDLTGQGDSDGRFADISRNTHQEDGKAVIESVATDRRFEGCEIITLGYSLGGLWAAYQAALAPAVVSRVIMLSPQLDCKRWAGLLLGNGSSDQPVVDWQGNVIPRVALEEMIRFDTTGVLGLVQGDMSMVTGSKDSLIPREVYAEY